MRTTASVRNLSYEFAWERPEYFGLHRLFICPSCWESFRGHNNAADVIRSTDKMEDALQGDKRLWSPGEKRFVGWSRFESWFLLHRFLSFLWKRKRRNGSLLSRKAFPLSFLFWEHGCPTSGMGINWPINDCAVASPQLSPRPPSACRCCRLCFDGSIKAIGVHTTRMKHR